MKTINFLNRLKKLIDSFYIADNDDALKKCSNFIDDCLLSLETENPEYGTVEYDENNKLKDKLNELDDLIYWYRKKILE